MKPFTVQGLSLFLVAGENIFNLKCLPNNYIMLPNFKISFCYSLKYDLLRD